MAKWHTLNHTILFRECDLTGNVHHPNYFKWFEDARFEIAQESRLLDGFNNVSDIFFPVIESKCKFIFPLQTGMGITLKTKLEMPKIAKLTFQHIILDVDDKKYAEGTTSVAIVSKSNGLLTKLDDNVKEIIKSYLVS